MIKPFNINVSDDILNQIYSKVKNYPWHEMPNDGGWEYGTNLNYMKEITKYWISEFDWRKHEKEINKFSNFSPSIASTYLPLINALPSNFSLLAIDL